VADQDDIKLEYDEAARAKLALLLERLQSELHKGTEDALGFAAGGVARSLSASTRRAPKMLRLHTNPGGDKHHRKDRFPWYVTRYLRNEPYRSWIRKSEDPEQKRRNPRAGLAAQSWFWTIDDLGLTHPYVKLRRPRGAAEGRIEKGINPTITLTNRLRYIYAAVRLGGPRGIETALERGASAGLRYLDRRLAKAVQK
jgi:hypothetical protein